MRALSSAPQRSTHGTGAVQEEAGTGLTGWHFPICAVVARAWLTRSAAGLLKPAAEQHHAVSAQGLVSGKGSSSSRVPASCGVTGARARDLSILFETGQNLRAGANPTLLCGAPLSVF